MRVISLLFHDVYVDHPAESGFVSAAANRYKLTVADFEAQLEGLRAVRFDSPVLASSIETRDHTIIPGAAPFAITVDDGGVSYYAHIAGRLENRDWRGHCFVSTDFIGARGFLSRAQIRELADRGHVIGSHSASHPSRFNRLPFHELADVLSVDGALSGIVVKDVKTKESRTLEADAVLPMLGFISDIGPLANWGLTLEKHEIVVNSLMETGRPGIYAAGDITSYPGKLKLIATGFAEACTAVNQAFHWIYPDKKVNPGHSSNLAVFGQKDD